jgi:hypothetical protein
LIVRHRRNFTGQLMPRDQLHVVVGTAHGSLERLTAKRAEHHLIAGRLPLVVVHIASETVA